MIGGYRVTQIVRTGTQLGICDALADGPRRADELASTVTADQDLLRRLMRALVGIGVLEEGEDGRFSNTELGGLLRTDAPASMRNTAIGLAEDAWWRAWSELPRGIENGVVPFELAHGASFWEVVGGDAAVAARFNGYMAAQTGALVPQLLAFDFSSCVRIVDVGGGSGALVAGILAAHPSLRATVFDLEAGLDGADEYLRTRGVRDRCDLVAGSFFDVVPSGADAYILSRILHDWDDTHAAKILANCRSAIRPGARLPVVDHILPARAIDQPLERAALIIDLHMYVLFGSRERTEEELRRMLGEAGFKVERVVPTSPPSTIVTQAF